MAVTEQSQTAARTADGREIETDDVGGGVLVFARCEERVGRELIGFANVDSRSALRASLARRGLGVGAVHNLETFEASEVGL